MSYFYFWLTQNCGHASMAAILVYVIISPIYIIMNFAWSAARWMIPRESVWPSGKVLGW